MTQEKKPDNGLIYQALSNIMAEIGAIGKDSTNQQQGFKFRGIDQVYNAMHPIMAKHKVYTVPRVLDMLARHDRQTARGGVITFTLLKVEYDFICGTDGSRITVGPIVAEGMDSGDKGCAKALAVAHKYAVFQTFLVPTEEAIDGDFDSYQVAPMNQPAPPKLQAVPAPIAPAVQAAVDGDATMIKPQIMDEKAAMDVADMIIQIAYDPKTKGSLRSLAEFWKKNAGTLDVLDHQYPEQYARVKAEFTNLRKQLEK